MMEHKKHDHRTPVILYSGSDTHLWSLSRTGFLEQFLCLTRKESLFQQAALRIANLGNADIRVNDPHHSHR